MTLSTLTNRVVYTGNGSTTQFAVPFKVLDLDHLVVQRRVASTDAVVYTYVGTDYSYSGLGSDSGTLTLNGTALSSTYELVIERIVPYTQELDLVNAGGFYPETVEEQLDLMVMQIQQVAARPDLLTAETLAQDALNVTQAVLAVESLTGVAFEAAARAASFAAVVANSEPAASFAAGETDVLAIDFTTSDTTHNIFIRDLSDPSNDTAGLGADIADLIPTAFQNVVNVIDEDGGDHDTVAGEVPYDWSQGERTVKVTAATLLTLPAALFTFGTNMTIKMEFYHGAGADNPFLMDAADDYADFRLDGVSYRFDLWNAYAGDPGGLKRTRSYPHTLEGDDEFIELVYRFADENHAISVNGQPPIFIPKHARTGVPSHNPADTFTPTNFKIQAGGGATFIYLRRLLITKRAVADEAFTNFRRVSGNPRIVTSAPVTRVFQDANYDRAVEGRISVLDDGSQSGLAVFNVLHTQRRYLNGGGVFLANGETAARLRQRTFQWAPGDTAVTAWSAAGTFYEPAGIANGLGHGQHGADFVRDQGPFKGRLYRFHTQLDGSFTTASDTQLEEGERNIYLSYSDQRGKAGTWSAATKVLDAGTIGAANYVLTSPAGDALQYAEDHPDYPGRVVIAFYTAGLTRLLYCDPDVNGNLTTWEYSSTPSGLPTGYSPNEASIVFAPNGDIIAVCRVRNAVDADVDNACIILRSTDGGETLAFARILVTTANDPINNVAGLTALNTTGYEGAAATIAAAQLDSSGFYAPSVGRIAIARCLHDASGTPDRYGLRVSVLEDTTFAVVDSFDVATGVSTIGAVSMKALYGGEYVVLSHNTSPDSGQNARDSYLVTIVDMPARGARE